MGKVQKGKEGGKGGSYAYCGESLSEGEKGGVLAKKAGAPSTFQEPANCRKAQLKRGRGKGHEKPMRRPY